MELGSNRIERISIADEVVKRLRDGICSGQVGIGEKLPTESELQASLGVGRSTIREALRMLQAMGLVEMRSGRGAFVRKNTVASLEDWVVENESLLVDMMEVRAAVEVLAARLACEHGADEQLRCVAQAHDAFLDGVGDADAGTLASLDEDFHSAIFAASNNVFLKRLSQVFTEPLHSYRVQSFLNAKLKTRAAGPHKRILDALLVRDAARASAAMRSHLEMSLRDLRQSAGHVLRIGE